MIEDLFDNLNYLLFQILIYAIKKYTVNIKEMSEITAREEMRENTPNDKRVPYVKSKDSFTKNSQLMPATLFAEVRFFFSQLYFNFF